VRLAAEATRVPPRTGESSRPCSGYRSWHASVSGNARPLSTREKHRRHIGWAISFEGLCRDASMRCDHPSLSSLSATEHSALHAWSACGEPWLARARGREESSVTRIATRSGPDLPRPDVVPRASRYAPSRGISSRKRATESCERITRRGVSAVAEPLNRDGVLPRASVVGNHSRIASTGCANLGAPMGDSRAAPFI